MTTTAKPTESKPIRPAATVVLLRESARSPEVLMVQRNRGAAFMADAHVFPGGRLDERDGGDYVLAAAREAFEEAGVVLAVDAEGRAPRIDEDREHHGWIEPGRLAVCGGTEDFTALLGAHGLRVDPARFAYFARWITPPSESRRFDARFFLARVPDGQTGARDAAGEVVDYGWATPGELLERHARGGIKLAPPTIWHLTDLARCPTVDAAETWARSRTVCAVRPKYTTWQGEPMILLPWDRDYLAAPEPVEQGEEPIGPAHPVATEVSRFVVVDGRWVGRSA